MKNLFAKILKVMQDVTYLQKDDSIGYGNNKYRAITEEKVTTEVGKSMRKHGLVILPIGVEERREDFDVVRANGKHGTDRITTITTKYLVADSESGESMEVCSAGAGVDSQDKGIGKALTYAYKYLLLRMFAIPTGEDPDKQASEDSTPSQQSTQSNNQEYITQQQRQDLQNNAIRLHGKDNAIAAITDMLNHFKLAKTSEIKAADYEKANQFISDWVAQ